MILVAIVALVVGVGAGLLAGFLVFGDAAGGDSRAEASASAGCVIVERLHEDGPLHDADFSVDDPEIWEISAAGSLFAAAAAADEDYASWEESGRELTAAIQRFDLELADDALETLASDCADR